MPVDPASPYQIRAILACREADRAAARAALAALFPGADLSEFDGVLGPASREVINVGDPDNAPTRWRISEVQMPRLAYRRIQTQWVSTTPRRVCQRVPADGETAQTSDDGDGTEDTLAARLAALGLRVRPWSGSAL